MYTFVWRMLLKHKPKTKQDTKFETFPELTNSGLTADTILSNSTNVISDTHSISQRHSTLDSEKNSDTDGIELVAVRPIKDSTVNINNESKLKPGHFDVQTVKYTTILFAVTVVFVVSFLPYLVLVIWRTAIGGHEESVLSDSGMVAFNFGVRSYFLNSAINPLVYGFFNSQFRKYFSARCVHFWIR